VVERCKENNYMRHTFLSPACQRQYLFRAYSAPYYGQQLAAKKGETRTERKREEERGRERKREEERGEGGESIRARPGICQLG
jgi:hypothetical protein